MILCPLKIRQLGFIQFTCLVSIKEVTCWFGHICSELLLQPFAFQCIQTISKSQSSLGNIYMHTSICINIKINLSHIHLKDCRVCATCVKTWLTCTCAHIYDTVEFFTHIVDPCVTHVSGKIFNMCGPTHLLYMYHVCMTCVPPHVCHLCSTTYAIPIPKDM